MDVETVVVEADSLLTSDQQDYPQELQPRDRTRAASQVQIEGIANNPIPARLDQSPETDRGAPIVTPEGIVESGNGRVMGLRRAFERGTVGPYLDYVRRTYPEAAGMRNPIIVRRRVSDVDQARFTVASNQSATLALSATERAQADSRLIDQEVLAQYRGGGLGNVGNRDMIRAFIGKLPQAEQGSLVTAEGGLSIEGQRRFQSALFHRAYGDDRILTRLTESPDDDMRSVTTALADSAGRMAQLRAAVERGEVAPEMDIAPQLMRAVQAIADLRAKDMDLRGFQSQQDAFAEPMEPLTEDLMRAFYNPAGTRLVSKGAMQDFIESYAAQASEEKIDQADLPGVEPRPRRTPEEIVDAARTREPDAQQGALLDAGGTTRLPRPPAGRGEARGAVDGGGREADRGEADQGAGRDRVGRRPPGKLSPQFLAFSINNKASVFESAMRDAGVSPEDARLMDVDKQVETIGRMIEARYGVRVEIPTMKTMRRNVVGRKVAAERTTIPSRMALDQLLDAYQNMQMLAAVLSLPEQAIGLPLNGEGITLSLVGTKQLRGALGMFSYGQDKDGKPKRRTITLPGRSNSFAHEWAHALDHWMHQVAGPEPDKGGLLSRIADDKGLAPPGGPVQQVTDAFAHLMVAMFADKARLEALTLAMQVQAEETNADGNPTPKARQAQQVLKDLKEGKRPPQGILSTYFKTSKAFDDSTGGSGYFTDPAEMFARAVEAWVGKTVGALTDLPQSFLSKGNWAYDSTDDTRLAQTFPKDGDQAHFDLAMSRLTGALRESALLGDGAAASAPTDTPTHATRDLLRAEAQRDWGDKLWTREKEELRRAKNRILHAIRPEVVKQTLAEKTKAWRTIKATMLNTTMAAAVRVAERQQTAEAREAVQNIIAPLGKRRPGSGTFTDNLYEEQVERTAKVRINKMMGAVRKAAGNRGLTPSDNDTLRRLLTGQAAPLASQKIKGLAADLRGILNEIWYDLQSVGMPVGYAKDYLPHIYDVTKVDADRAGFRGKAQGVYRLMFQREVREQTDETEQIKDMNRVIRGLRGITRATPEGGRTEDGRLTGSDEALIARWRKLRQKLNSLKRQAEKDPLSTKIGDKIVAAEDELGELHEEVLDLLESRWSAYSAEAWDSKIGIGHLHDIHSLGPTSSFLKGRVLPKEAGWMLKDFMLDDPLELIQGYAFSTARRVEYARMFGADSSKLANMMEAARKAGVPADDISFLKEVVATVTGQKDYSTRGMGLFRSYAFTYMNVALLGAATFSSLAESVTVGMRTGSVGDSARAVIQALRGLSPSRYQDLAEIARTIGLIAPYAMETVVQSRMSVDASSLTESQQKTVQRFFTMTGLTPLTNFQRVTLVPVAHHVIRRLLRDSVRGEKPLVNRARDVIAGGKGAFANDELNELGIAEEVRADLLDWIESMGDLPETESMFAPDGTMHPAAEIYSRALSRLVNETIQNPLKSDRAMQANSPDWAAIYAIQSFVDAFTRNIIFRTLGRGIDPEDPAAKRAAKMTANVALAAAPYGALLMGQFLSTILREFLVNHDKWEEKDDDDELLEWLMKRAFARTSPFGRLDPLYQAITGIRYETDLTSLTTGPALTFLLQRIKTIGNVWAGRNSENTNTAEFNAARAAYEILVEPALGAAIAAYGPGGPISGLVMAALFQVGSSGSAAQMAAESAVGEKGGPLLAPWDDAPDDVEETP